MAKETVYGRVYIEQIFHVQCYGRNGGMQEVLTKPVDIKVRIRQLDEKHISSTIIECEYKLDSGHCSAKRIGRLMPYCPYNATIPNSIDELNLLRMIH